MPTRSQTLRSVAKLARERAASIHAGASDGGDAPSSTEALDQIACDLDAAASFIGNPSNLERLAYLLREAVAIADAVGLDVVAAHANLAVDTLEQGSGDSGPQHELGPIH